MLPGRSDRAKHAANKDHHPALRCAVGVFVPLFMLVLLGRLDLAIFASFGAFTGIYGRREPHGIRFAQRMVPSSWAYDGGARQSALASADATKVRWKPPIQRKGRVRWRTLPRVIRWWTGLSVCCPPFPRT